MAASKKSSVKKAAKKAVKKAAPKKAAAKKASPLKSTRKLERPGIIGLPPKARKTKVYIHASAFLPLNSAEGYTDLFQSGRRSNTQDGNLAAPIPLPVGAKLLSLSIHYTNSTSQNKLAIFLRLHQDRHSPSGEIEMSFINLPNTPLPPDNYLTVTDTSFPNSGVIQDKFLHYLYIPTGDWGAGGSVSVRGVSLVYSY